MRFGTLAWVTLIGVVFAGCGGDENADFGGGNQSGGSGGTAGSGGTGGTGTGGIGGTGGVAGAAGTGGSGGTGGVAGAAGTGGAAGAAGTGGVAGAAGTGGSAGSAGTGGSAGSAGTGGSAGAAGTGGAAGAAGSGGSTGTPPHAGLSFWAADLPNERYDASSAHAMTWALLISNVGSANASVVVERNNAGPGAAVQLATEATLNLAPGAVQQVELQPREVTGVDAPSLAPPMTALSSKALRVTSDQPIIVVQMNTADAGYSNDGTVLLPFDKLGAAHRVLGWPTTNPEAPFPIPGVPDHSSVTVIGTASNTLVTVHTTHALLGNGSIQPTPAGGTLTATLGPFDVLNLASDGTDGDLSGTTVEASAPVAVFTSGERIMGPSAVQTGIPVPPGVMPADNCCTDHFEEQLPPNALLGSRFAIPHSPFRSNAPFREADMIRFVGGSATAQVSTSLPPPHDVFTLAPGEVHDAWTIGDVVAESTVPILVGQVLVSAGMTGRNIGDPSLTLVPPLAHHGNSFDFLVPAGWDETYVTVASPAGNNVTIDGGPASCETANAGNIGAGAWIAMRCVVGDGVHTIAGASPIGVIVYGYGSVGSFAYAAGGT